MTMGGNSGVCIGFRESTDIIGEQKALVDRAAEDGYLYFRGLIPRETILELRLQFLLVLDRFGWLDRNYPLGQGVSNLGACESIVGYCGNMISREAYREIQKLELFHSLPHHPRLVELYRKLFGGEVFVHPRNIGRIFFPVDRMTPTAPHQDYIHVQGTQQTWTCWFPLGDTPREMGGLAVLEGSHRDGIYDIERAEGPGGFESIICDSNPRWRESDFQAGDIITFPSLTIHRGIRPRRRDRVRLSCDYRYQPYEKPIERKSLFPHCNVASWDEIYSGWQHKGLQYYWRKRGPKIKPWEDILRWQKDRIC